MTASSSADWFLIDSDMIVTRSLEPVLERAEAGQVCMFADIQDQRHRFVPEWEDAFGLTAPLRRAHYMNAGFIALSTRHHPDLLRRYWEVCRRIPSGQTLVAASDYDQPFWGGDQDAINALLMSEVDRDAVTELPHEEGPSPELLHDVRVLDERTLECELRDTGPTSSYYGAARSHGHGTPGCACRAMHRGSCRACCRPRRSGAPRAGRAAALAAADSRREERLLSSAA
jgi:hypothetical protein